MAKDETSKPPVREKKPTKIYKEDWERIIDIQINAKQARMPEPSFADVIEAAMAKYKPKLYKVPDKKP